MWDNAEKMFPMGYTPNDPSVSVNDLRSNGYSMVSMRVSHMARGMVTKLDQHSWLPDGSYVIENVYDVYHYPCVDGTPHLSVYGQKMLNNFRDRKQEEQENVGFNYTGL